MLFTVIPAEDVWSEGPAGREPPEPRHWIALPRGCMVCVRGDPADGQRVERLLSLEPRDYLNPLLQPGAPWRRPPL